jgi:putative acyl-CoA dehydrogenase
VAYRTHEVTNQPPPLVGYDVVLADRALVEAVRRHGGGVALDRLAKLGRLAGSPEAQRWAVEADQNPPTLRAHDRYGNRVDEVDFHPSWHRLLDTAVSAGLAGAAWAEPAEPAVPAEPAETAQTAQTAQTARHVVRAAGFYAWSQVEAGHGCPVSMTYAAVPALRAAPGAAALAAEWLPRLTTTAYDPGLRPPDTKAGCLAGMGMTEKQGGSDVRASTTTAVPAGADAGCYALTGHKWFCSAPMSDLFLVLAQAPGGLSCFVVPRVLPDGGRNDFRIQRLKDKLGNRSNASSEVEFDGTLGWLLGDEGRGVPTIIEMVAMTRLDCVLGSAALQRRAVAEAAHHAAHRNVFGARLADQPLMRAVLADLAVESEAATTLAMRLAAAVDAGETAFLRLALPVAKYWVCKRTPAHVAEALECLGGNGYVEDSGMPRLYREAPLNSIWEGAGNINALDVLRALAREPAALDAFAGELTAAAGADRRLDAAVAALREDIPKAEESSARRLAGRMALALQGALLTIWAPPAVADAFCASRLDPEAAGTDGTAGGTFGELPNGLDAAAIVARARPDTRS